MNKSIQKTSLHIALLLLNVTAVINANAQQTLNATTITDRCDRNYIQFTVPHEVNINYYLIEAGTDTANYNIIGRIAARGSSVLPLTYKYELLETGYKYYRVRQVDISRNCSYSKTLEMNNYINTPGVKTENNTLAIKTY